MVNGPLPESVSTRPAVLTAPTRVEKSALPAAISTRVSDFMAFVVDEFDFAVVSEELEFESLLQATAPRVSEAATIKLPTILMGRDDM
ncbi:unannotated protein [freshwater metagenome]|uniref:Unannotated protein n=2 Tax=freshwater metagenome TaxID=449393 RepID=A0A6J6CHV8_9ZZZZ